MSTAPRPSELPGRRPSSGWLRSRSLRSRIAALIAMSVGFTIIGAGIAVYFSVKSQLNHQLDSSLLSRAEGLSRALTLQQVDVLQKTSTAAFGAADIKIAVISDGRLSVIGSTDSQSVSSPLLSFPAPVARDYDVVHQRIDRAIHTAVDNDVSYRVVSVSTFVTYSDYRNAAGQLQPVLAAVSLAKPLTDTEQSLQGLLVILLVVGVFGVVVSAMIGFVVARAGLRPVDRLTRAAEHVARTQDLTPIPVEGNDELARLARSFNSMLAALDESRRQQQQLVADASHELRTPLTSLRTNIDLLVQASNPDGPHLDPTDHRELMEDVRAQIDELTGLIADLTALARESRAPAVIAPLDLAEVAERAAERAGRRRADVTIVQQLEPWEVLGNDHILERAVTNLLDNAVKWSPPGGTVHLTLRAGTLTVTDQGPGIPEQDLPHVFERFYRSAESRSMPGSGLGLAIVREAISDSGGTVTAARAAGGGTLMTVTLPGSPATAAKGRAAKGAAAAKKASAKKTTAKKSPPKKVAADTAAAEKSATKAQQQRDRASAGPGS